MRALTLTVLLAASLLAGCATPARKVVIRAQRFDLGPPPESVPVRSVPGTRLPVLKIATVESPADLASDEIRYRLRYSATPEANAYAHSRWTMTPAQLLTARLRDVLAARFTVLGGGDPVKAPLLSVQISEFSQWFDAPRESRGVVQLRASLIDDRHVVAQRAFSASAPAPSADAAGGVAALTQASDRAFAEMADWLAGQPGMHP